MEHAQRDDLTSAKTRMFARNALALLLAMVPATAAIAENDVQSANSIMPGCNAWIAQLSRGSTALGSNVFLAGECLGIVGTILYFSRDFSYSSAACPADRGAACDARVVAGLPVKAAGLCCLNFGPASVRAGRGCRGSDWGIVLGSNCAHTCR